MSASTDTFVRFVDVLAESLAAPVAPGRSLMGRLHLSRYYAGRIVSAAAGESPEAIRRRILLERAAHSLATTDADVLSIALDAGYGSHEAFTRAFQRAYGEPPSVWRRTPRAFELPAPSGLHFNPPGGLRLPATRKVTSMDLLQRMVEHHIWLLGQMIDRAAGLSAEVLDAPIELSVESIDEHPTLRSLLSRLVGQLAMWNAAVGGKPYDFSVEEGECPRDMGERLDREGPAFAARTRQVLAEGTLDETFVDAICEPSEVFSYGGMIAHVLTFAAHRRTLALAAFAESGITDLGSGDPMLWVAEAA